MPASRTPLTATMTSLVLALLVGCGGGGGPLGDGGGPQGGSGGTPTPPLGVGEPGVGSGGGDDAPGQTPSTTSTFGVTPHASHGGVGEGWDRRSAFGEEPTGTSCVIKEVDVSCWEVTRSTALTSLPTSEAMFMETNRWLRGGTNGEYRVPPERFDDSLRFEFSLVDEVMGSSSLRRFEEDLSALYRRVARPDAPPHQQPVLMQMVVRSSLGRISQSDGSPTPGIDRLCPPTQAFTPASFADACGTSLVTSTERGSMLVLLLDMSRLGIRDVHELHERYETASRDDDRIDPIAELRWMGERFGDQLTLHAHGYGLPAMSGEVTATTLADHIELTHAEATDACRRLPTDPTSQRLDGLLAQIDRSVSSYTRAELLACGFDAEDVSDLYNTLSCHSRTFSPTRVPRTHAALEDAVRDVEDLLEQDDVGPSRVMWGRQGETEDEIKTAARAFLFEVSMCEASLSATRASCAEVFAADHDDIASMKEAMCGVEGACRKPAECDPEDLFETYLEVRRHIQRVPRLPGLSWPKFIDFVSIFDDEDHDDEEVGRYLEPGIFWIQTSTSRVNRPARLGDVLCLLTHVRGEFAGGGELAQVLINWDQDKWYVWKRSMRPERDQQLDVGAYCIPWSSLSDGLGTQAQSLWDMDGSSDQGVKRHLLAVDEPHIMLVSGIRGRFESGGEQVWVTQQNEDGHSELLVSSSGGLVEGHAVAFGLPGWSEAPIEFETTVRTVQGEDRRKLLPFHTHTCALTSLRGDFDGRAEFVQLTHNEDGHWWAEVGAACEARDEAGECARYGKLVEANVLCFRNDGS